MRGDAPENVSEDRDPKGGDGFGMTIPTGVNDLPLDPTADLVQDPSTV